MLMEIDIKSLYLGVVTDIETLLLFHYGRRTFLTFGSGRFREAVPFPRNDLFPNHRVMQVKKHLPGTKEHKRGRLSLDLRWNSSSRHGVHITLNILGT